MKPKQPDSTSESHDQAEDSGQDSGEAESDEQPADQSETQEKSHDPFEGYSDEPFVRAVAMFHAENYNGIIEILTEAVEKGRCL